MCYMLADDKDRAPKKIEGEEERLDLAEEVGAEGVGEQRGEAAVDRSPLEEKEKEGGAEKEEKEDLEKLKEEASRLQKENEELFSRLQRLQADFDNYRKRMQAERRELLRYALFDFAGELLPLVDNLERALESARQKSQEEDLVKGLDMILRQFYQVLQQEGITPIEAVGQEFDPMLHEAVMQVEDEENPPNAVVEELQKGYKYKDRVLRPSRVKVAR